MRIKIRFKREFVKKVKLVVVGLVLGFIICSILSELRVAGINTSGEYFETRNIKEVITQREVD